MSLSIVSRCLCCLCLCVVALCAIKYRVHAVQGMNTIHCAVAQFIQQIMPFVLSWLFQYRKLNHSDGRKPELCQAQRWELHSSGIWFCFSGFSDPHLARRRRESSWSRNVMIRLRIDAESYPRIKELAPTPLRNLKTRNSVLFMQCILCQAFSWFVLRTFLFLRFCMPSAQFCGESTHTHTHTPHIHHTHHTHTPHTHHTRTHHTHHSHTHHTHHTHTTHAHTHARTHTPHTHHTHTTHTHTPHTRTHHTHTHRILWKSGTNHNSIRAFKNLPWCEERYCVWAAFSKTGNYRKFMSVACMSHYVGKPSFRES